MKRLRFFVQFAMIALLALLTVFQTSSAAFAQGGNNNFVPGQLVVQLDPLQGAIIDQINATYGTTTIRPLADATGVYLLQAPIGADIRALAATMSADQRLLYAQPNHFSQVIEGVALRKWARADADPAVMGSQYAVTLLDLAGAHALSTGANTIVAVLDTGFQLDHPQLVDSFTSDRYDFVDYDAIPAEDFANLDPDGDGFVNELAGHGTHIAGIVHLVAPHAKIMPLRVMDSNGLGNEVAVVEAVRYAVAHGADVINLSLGTAEKSELLNDVLERTFGDDHVLIVAAAGNDNSQNELWPAASSHVIAVTSVGPTKKKSSFSNSGSWVDIAAPGEEITSTFPSNQFASWSGTSFATPFIAGQLALLRSLNPTLDNNKLSKVLRDTAEPLHGDIGAGFPNLVASLQEVTNPDDSTPTATPTATPTLAPTAVQTPTPSTATPAVTTAATPTMIGATTTPTGATLQPTAIAATPTPRDGTLNPLQRFQVYLGIVKK